MSREQGTRMLFRTHPFLADVLLAAALYTAEMTLWMFGPREVWPPSWPVALAWSALGISTVAIRRRWPWPAVGLLVTHSLVPFAVLPYQLSTQGFAIIVLTYTTAAHQPLRRAVLATALIWVPVLTLAVVLWDSAAPPPLRLNLGYFLAFNALVALICFFIGRTVYTRRAYVAALEDRARTAEQNQQSLADQAVAEERRRIARELHDVVAHHVSVMGVLATGSRRMLTRDPGAADEALATIEETGRTALREMRRLLDVLRTDQEPAGELSPQPGVSAIEGLVEQVREAGLPTTLTCEGHAEGLEPGVTLSVYRIVQEALTNSLKHAGTASASVRICFSARDVTVEVCDNGRGPRLSGVRAGHGLVGMRERVSLYGGTLRVGPRPGGGFRVYAKIPVESWPGERGAA